MKVSLLLVVAIAWGTVASAASIDVTVESPEGKQTQVSKEALNAGQDLPMSGSGWNCFIIGPRVLDDKSGMVAYIKCRWKKNRGAGLMVPLIVYASDTLKTSEVSLMNGDKRDYRVMFTFKK
jgi:hypothetical protein